MNNQIALPRNDKNDAVGDPTPPSVESVSIDYLLEHGGGSAVHVFLSCMGTKAPFWRPLLERGVARTLSESKSLRQEFLRRFALMSDLVLAEDMLRTCLEQLPPVKQKKFFDVPSHRGSETCLYTAIKDQCLQQNPDPAKATPTWVLPGTPDLLIKIAQEYNADFSKQVKFKWKYRSAEMVTPIENAILDREFDSIKSYLDLGLPFGEPEIARVIAYVTAGDRDAARLLELALSSDVEPSVFAAAVADEKAPPDAVSVVHAALAKRAISSTIKTARPTHA